MQLILILSVTCGRPHNTRKRILITTPSGRGLQLPVRVAGQARVVDAAAAIITDIEAPSRTYSPGDNWTSRSREREDRPAQNCPEPFHALVDLANDRLAAELGGRYVPYGAQALPHNGSATRSLTFRYVVRVGDESERLETACVPCASAVVETAALWANASCNPLTLATNRPASLILPRTDEGTLSKTSNVVVTSAPRRS